MKAFWRKTPLTHNEEALLSKCLEAHYEAAFRENLSSSVIVAAYQGNGSDFLKAVASGLGTLGGAHGPVTQAYEVLKDEHHEIVSHAMGRKIAGWGSAFVKGEPDPIVERAMLYVDVGWPDIGKRIEVITDTLHYHNKIIFPNMACLTAATAIILGMPKELSPVLLLHGRTMAWAQLIHDAQRQAPEDQVRDHGGRV